MALPTSGQTDLGVAPNVGGLLCYAPCCIGVIFSIVAVIVEKQSRYLRFHAFQSLLVHAGLFVVIVALEFAFFVMGALSHGLAGLFGLVLWPLIGLAMLAGWVFLMMKAYNNEEFQLPVVGEMAKKWA